VGFSVSGDWTTVTSQGGVNGDYRQTASPSDSAEWLLTVTPGKRYVLLATWQADDDNSPLVTYHAFDGLAEELTRTVDQRSPAVDWQDDGHDWHLLDSLVVGTTGTGNLRIRLSAGQPGVSVADAVRVIEVGPMDSVGYDGLGRMISQTNELGQTTPSPTLVGPTDERHPS
jgi:hypothetical protein